MSPMIAEGHLRVRFEGRVVRGRHPMLYLRDNVLFIADADDGGRTITNDASAVVAEVVLEFGPDCRLIYRDTDDRWDEIVISSGGHFGGFAPYKGWVPETCKEDPDDPLR